MESLEEVNDKTRRAYDLVAERYDELFHDEMERKEYDRELLDSLAARLPAGARVCDVGCGPSGHVARYLADRGVGVTGVDISQRCVEQARRRNPKSTFERQDFSRLTFADASFDAIVSFYSIIDTPKCYLDLVFRELGRVLKPGGLLVVVVKAGEGEGYLDELLGTRTEIYMSLFSRDEIRDLLVRSGFAVEFLEMREPLPFEIATKRIYAIGVNPSAGRP
ncbi:MAG: class I SAM-dependent DNA methyltransferase [Thermoanaerobaculia bacterium]